MEARGDQYDGEDQAGRRACPDALRDKQVVRGVRARRFPPRTGATPARWKSSSRPGASSGRRHRPPLRPRRPRKVPMTRTPHLSGSRIAGHCACPPASGSVRQIVLHTASVPAAAGGSRGRCPGAPHASCVVVRPWSGGRRKRTGGGSPSAGRSGGARVQGDAAPCARGTGVIMQPDSYGVPAGSSTFRSPSAAQVRHGSTLARSSMAAPARRS
jgi:hypothetical protein